MIEHADDVVLVEYDAEEDEYIIRDALSGSLIMTRPEQADAEIIAYRIRQLARRHLREARRRQSRRRFRRG